MRNGKYVTCLRGSTRYAAIDNRAIDCLAESVREDSSFDHIPLHSSRRHERAIVLVVDIRELRIRANSACKRDLEETAIASILVAEPFGLFLSNTPSADITFATHAYFHSPGGIVVRSTST